LYICDGADYFCKLIPHAEKIILEDCGHFMAIDKPEDTARSIMNFFDNHCSSKVKQLAIPEFD
jgi:pimeloyl-ACP methyl ester carboxylesterase